MKQFLFAIISCAFFIFVQTGCNSLRSSTPDFTSLKKIIDAKNKDWAAAVTRGDSADMLNRYMDDAKVSAPGMEPAISKGPIAMVVSQLKKDHITQYERVITDLYGNDDNIIEEGKYISAVGNGNPAVPGKYITIWRKVNGDWKVYSEIWNTNIK